LSEDERNAAQNDVIKMEGSGWIVSNGLYVDASLASQSAQNSQSGQATDTPGPWSEPSGSEKPNITLCPGTTVVTAIASQGDYESIKTVESVDTKGVLVKYSSEDAPECSLNSPGCGLIQTSTHRTVLSSDLGSAHKYDEIFVTDKNSSEIAPGTTAIGTSAEVLRELKSKGESELTLCAGADDTFEKTSDGQLHPVPGGCFAWGETTVIKRIGSAPVPVRVLLDGVPVDLPAVHAQGLHGRYGHDERSEFFFLDDERNPLTLKFRLGIGRVPALSPDEHQLCERAKAERRHLVFGGDDPPSCDLPEGGDRDVLTVVKINTRCELPHTASSGGKGGGGAGGEGSSGASALEKALAETGKVDIYSIYFSFNSDKLREESQPTLNDIAEVLRRHPDWKLQVNGHTDGIGGDAFNLDLSKRRSSSVKDALVKQYKIGGDRLATAGYGKSQPKDTNETLEGRARNRRVELMKIS
jgi:outer membrane protein OmpA-like peptidoglycan-associated protein